MCRKNAGYGRIEKRNCTVVSYGSIMEKMFKEKLVGLKSVVRIKSERTIVAIGEYTQEVRYYVTSLDNLSLIHISLRKKPAYLHSGSLFP